jgi:aspartyl-tRNA(Asn)/glutamyl-tRNA(Gln) amidotransferase subunit C
VAKRISTDDVAHVARLARLDLEAADLERFTDQLAAVLDHAADVEALDLNDVEPMVHPLPLRNVLRDDEPAGQGTPATVDRDEVLAAAPDTEDGQFRVPPILGEEP